MFIKSTDFKSLLLQAEDFNVEKYEFRKEESEGNKMLFK